MRALLPFWAVAGTGHGPTRRQTPWCSSDVWHLSGGSSFLPGRREEAWSPPRRSGLRSGSAPLGERRLPHSVCSDRWAVPRRIHLRAASRATLVWRASIIPGRTARHQGASSPRQPASLRPESAPLGKRGLLHSVRNDRWAGGATGPTCSRCTSATSPGPESSQLVSGVALQPTP